MEHMGDRSTSAIVAVIAIRAVFAVVVTAGGRCGLHAAHGESV